MIHDFGGVDLFSLSEDFYDIYDTELGELTVVSIELDCLDKDSWKKRWTALGQYTTPTTLDEQ